MASFREDFIAFMNKRDEEKYRIKPYTPGDPDVEDQWETNCHGDR